MIYVITGHLGSGKTLLACELAFQYLREGKRVASNMTFNLNHALPKRSRAVATKLPYIPTREHLEQLGKGYEGEYDESKFGLVLLDEAGTWLNSRDWNDKDRRGLFTWITHARKHGWDVALIVQDYEALDAQIRRSVTEAYVSCSRLDRIKIPYLPVKLPRMHLATARYQGAKGPVMRRWLTRGTDIFKAYNTRESVVMENEWTASGPVDMRASSNMLSAWHLEGRYLPPPLSLTQKLLRLFFHLTAFLVKATAMPVLLFLAAGTRSAPAVKPPNRYSTIATVRIPRIMYIMLNNSGKLHPMQVAGKVPRSLSDILFEGLYSTGALGKTPRGGLLELNSYYVLSRSLK